MQHGLTQAERQCVLAHDLEHVTRGPFPRHAEAKEEAVVNAAASRNLINLTDLGEALAWSHNLRRPLTNCGWISRPCKHECSIYTRLNSITCGADSPPTTNTTKGAQRMPSEPDVVTHRLGVSGQDVGSSEPA